MLSITPAFSLDENELSYSFIRASGPGGQNVNKVATAVQLRFDVLNSSLPPEVKERLCKLAGSRLSSMGVLVIEAKRYRTQEQNRQDAEARLVTLLQKAFEKPVYRRPTRPSAGSVARRLETKKRRSDIKRVRRSAAESE